MTSAAAVDLAAEIQELARDFVLENGRVLMPDDKVIAWGEALATASAQQRPALAADLIALAFKLARRAGDQAAIAVTQLFVLAVHLLNSRHPAEAAFHAAGIDPKEAARLTGRSLDQVAPEPSRPCTGGIGLRKK